MEVPLFEQVAHAVRSSVRDELGPVRSRCHSYSLKVWLGDRQPPREHYEAQLLPRALVDGREGVAMEVGFHVEHSKEEDNDHTLDLLVARERSWRRALGDEAVAGPFLGRATWRRLSETWLDFELDDPDLVLELADRLSTYINALEPLRHPPT
jgi:hypothetical protein